MDNQLKTDLLHLLALKASDAKILYIHSNITPKIYHLIKEFIKNNSTLETIHFSGKKEEFYPLLNVISISPLQLKELIIDMRSLREQEINALIEVVKLHPLNKLGLTFLEIKTNNENLIKRLAATIAENSNLITLDVRALKFSSPTLENIFIEGLCQSRSLLSIHNWDGIHKQKALKEVLDRNCMNCLQKREYSVSALISSNSPLYANQTSSHLQGEIPEHTFKKIKRNG